MTDPKAKLQEEIERLCEANWRQNLWYPIDTIGQKKAINHAFASGAEAAIGLMQCREIKLVEALRKIHQHETCEALYGVDKYKSYEDGWHGVSEYAGKVLRDLAST